MKRIKKTFWLESLHLEGFFFLSFTRILFGLTYCPAPGGWGWRTDRSSIITLIEFDLKFWQRF